MGIEASLLSLMVVAVYTVLCTGLGLTLLSSVRASLLGHSRAFLLSVGFCLGQAVLLIAWLLLALQGQLLGLPVGIVLFVAGVSGIWGFRYYRQTARNERPRNDNLTRVLGSIIILLAGVYLLRSFGPFLQGDAVAYYLTVARETALEGRHGISWLNYAPFFSFGFEGHFAVLYMLSGESAVTLFDGVLALNSLILVYSLAEFIGLSHRAALLAVLTVISTAGFEEAVGGGKVDIASAQLGFAAILLGLVSLTATRKHFRYALLAGLLAGVCMIAKVSNALILPVTTIAFVIAWQAQADRRKTIAALWVVFGGAAVIAMTPHFYKMYVTLGEPLLPFLTLFEHAAMPPWAANAPKVIGLIHGMRTLSNLDLGLLPLTWTFVDRPFMGGNISPLYLAFLPLGFLVKWPKQVKLLGLMALGAIAIWFVISPTTLQTRYHFIGLMLLAVVTGSVMDQLLEFPKLKRPILIALLLVFAVTLGGARKIRYAIPYITGHLSRDAYFDKHPWLHAGWSLANAVNHGRAKSERAYLTRSGWYYVYFMDDATLRSSQRPEEALVTWRLGWNAAAWEYIYERGFRLVMASKKEVQEGELTVAQVKNAPPTLALEALFEDEATILYRITSSQPESTP